MLVFRRVRASSSDFSSEGTNILCAAEIIYLLPEAAHESSNLAVFLEERRPAWSTEINAVAFLRGCLFNTITVLGRPVARLTVKRDQIFYISLFRMLAF